MKKLLWFIGITAVVFIFWKPIKPVALKAFNWAKDFVKKIKDKQTTP